MDATDTAASPATPTTTLLDPNGFGLADDLDGLLGGAGEAEAGGGEGGAGEAQAAEQAAAEAAAGATKTEEESAAAGAQADPAAGEGAADAGQPEPFVRDKVIQKMQEKIANTDKAFKQVTDTLELLVKRLEAAPPPANTAQAQQQQEQKDLLADLEAQINDPAFDPYDPKVLKNMVGALKQVREETREVKKAGNVQNEAAAYWTKFAQENPEVGITVAQDLWSQAVAQANADTELGTIAEKHGAAKVIWRGMVKAAKAQKPAAGAIPSTAAAAPASKPVPQPRSGGAIAPTVGRGTPAPKAKTLDERVAAGEFNLADELGSDF